MPKNVRFVLPDCKPLSVRIVRNQDVLLFDIADNLLSVLPAFGRTANRAIATSYASATRASRNILLLALDRCLEDMASHEDDLVVVYIDQADSNACTAPYDSSTQIPSLGEGDYASIVFDNELSDIPQGNITYRWFKCAGLGSGAGLVAKELGSSPSLSLSGLQGSYINCEVTLTVNGKSKTFVPKAICNGKVSDGIYVRPRIG